MSQRELLSVSNCAVSLIDHQPSTTLDVESTTRGAVMDAAIALAQVAAGFKIPTVLTTVVADRSGPIYPEIQAAFPDQKPINRTTMNAWADENYKSAVEALGKKKILMAGLWTEVCLELTVLSALYDGYEIYFATDASGGLSKQAHETAVMRMTQAGAIPTTWMAFMAELEPDWNKLGQMPEVLQAADAHLPSLSVRTRYAAALKPEMYK